MGNEGEQHIACVGNGRVGEQTAKAGLRDRDQISEQHRGDRDGDDHRHPSALEVVQRRATLGAGKANHQDLEEDEEACDLGAGRDEGGARSGRALVDVWRPEVEGRGGDLESEADHGRNDRKDHEGVERRRVDCAGDLEEVGRIGEAVEQAEAEQHEGRRHSAEEEVFESSFGGAGAALVEPCKNVDRQAQQLERDEDDEEVLRGDEKHHASCREQDQENKFADVIGEGGVHREEERQDGDDQQRDLNQVRSGIG